MIGAIIFIIIMEKFTLIIPFPVFHGVTSIEIHKQLSETCSDSVMEQAKKKKKKKVRSWMLRLKKAEHHLTMYLSSPYSIRLQDCVSGSIYHITENRRLNVHVFKLIILKSDKVWTS